MKALLMTLSRAAAFACGAVQAQMTPDAVALMNAQRQAMAPLAVLDGTWRGTAKIFTPGGATRELVQTERAGSMLSGTVKVVEGRGYGTDGSLEFNAFAVISYVPATGRHVFNSWAQGHKGEYAFETRPDGFVWTLKYGPVTIRHTATVKGDRWVEIGERLQEGQPPVRMVEMNLQRIGATGWPEAGAVPLQ